MQHPDRVYDRATITEHTFASYPITWAEISQRLDALNMTAPAHMALFLDQATKEISADPNRISLYGKEISLEDWRATSEEEKARIRDFYTTNSNPMVVLKEWIKEWIINSA